MKYFGDGAQDETIRIMYSVLLPISILVAIKRSRQSSVPNTNQKLTTKKYTPYKSAIPPPVLILFGLIVLPRVSTARRPEILTACPLPFVSFPTCSSSVDNLCIGFNIDSVNVSLSTRNGSFVSTVQYQSLEKKNIGRDIHDEHAELIGKSLRWARLHWTHVFFCVQYWEGPWDIGRGK